MSVRVRTSLAVTLYRCGNCYDCLSVQCDETYEPLLVFSVEYENLVHCSLSILLKSFVHFIPIKLDQNQFTSMTCVDSVVIVLLLFGANR